MHTYADFVSELESRPRDETPWQWLNSFEFTPVQASWVHRWAEERAATAVNPFRGVDDELASIWTYGYAQALGGFPREDPSVGDPRLNAFKAGRRAALLSDVRP